MLSGLNRVRQITLDDTHMFCRPDQLIAEVARALPAALQAQHILELPVDYVRLSRGAATGDLGTADQWRDAEQALRTATRQVLGADGPAVVEVTGEAAFYGPKLDLQTRSSDIGKRPSPPCNSTSTSPNDSM